MKPIKYLCAAGLAIGATFMSAPTASAQGKADKVYKAQGKAEARNDKETWKTEKKVVKQDIKWTKEQQRRRARLLDQRRRAASRTSRALCSDGVWVNRSTNACRDHGGFATYQGRYYRPTPVASARARERASVNSAVRRGSYANLSSQGAIARCMDGMYWHSATRIDACYRHGGVARWY